MEPLFGVPTIPFAAFQSELFLALFLPGFPHVWYERGHRKAMLTGSNREREIFDAAVEVTSAEARSAYLIGACGEDAELRARVEALLRAHEQAGGFLPMDDAKSQTAASTIARVAVMEMFPVTE